MPRNIFVNLPVSDLNRSIKFFSELGFTFNQQWTDETATCMVVSDTIFVMLLTEAKFKGFIKKEICNAQTHTEVLVCLSLESREAVDVMTKTALASGGSLSCEPKDYGFMYQNGFQDPDGHIWELVYLDPAAPQG